MRVAAALAPLLLLACGGEEHARACATAGEGLLATVRVGAETYRQLITSDAGVTGALTLWTEGSTANIPTGVLVCEPAAWNCDWSWHVQPDTLEFADVTTELCDGSPSYVEASCASFGERYCPWSAELVELRDCRVAASCPGVPR